MKSFEIMLCKFRINLANITSKMQSHYIILSFILSFFSYILISPRPPALIFFSSLFPPTRLIHLQVKRL